MRQFILYRKEDISGVSGTGTVAEGVEFSNGQAVLHWLTKYSSLGIYESVDQLMDIHGHDGRTVLVYSESE